MRSHCHAFAIVNCALHANSPSEIQGLPRSLTLPKPRNILKIHKCQKMIENPHLRPHFEQALGQTPSNTSPRPSHKNFLTPHLWNGPRMLTDSFLFREGLGKLTRSVTQKLRWFNSGGKVKHTSQFGPLGHLLVEEINYNKIYHMYPHPPNNC